MVRKHLEYKELVVFKNGDTSYETDIVDVIGYMNGWYEIVYPGRNKSTVIRVERVDGGPQENSPFIHSDEVLKKHKVECCFSDIRVVRPYDPNIRRA